MNLSKFLTFLVLVLLLATFSLQLFGLMTINTIEVGKNETVKGEIDKVCVKRGKTNYYPCALRYIFSFGNEAPTNRTEIEIDEYETDEEENYLGKPRERKVLIFSLFYFTWTFLLLAFFCILSKFFYNHKHNFINIVSGSLIAISVSSSFIIMLINGFANYQDSIYDDSESPLLYQTGFLALYASLFTSFFSSIFSCFNQSWLMALKRNNKAINRTIPHLSKAK